MSVAAPQSPGGSSSAGATAPAPVGEGCPLCGAPLHPEQGWCLSCGAAARTRLAAAPGWKGPFGVFAVVVALALGVLAAALVDLAGGSGTPTPTITRTVTTSAALAPTTSTAATAPGAGQLGASTSTTTSTATPGATTNPTAATTPALTHTGTTPTTTATGATGTVSIPKLSPQAKREISKALKERLGKFGAGKAPPGTPSG